MEVSSLVTPQTNKPCSCLDHLIVLVNILIDRRLAVPAQAFQYHNPSHHRSGEKRACCRRSLATREEQKQSISQCIASFFTCAAPCCCCRCRLHLPISSLIRSRRALQMPRTARAPSHHRRRTPKKSPSPRCLPPTRPCRSWTSSSASRSTRRAHRSCTAPLPSLAITPERSLASRATPLGVRVPACPSPAATATSPAFATWTTHRSTACFTARTCSTCGRYSARASCYSTPPPQTPVDRFRAMLDATQQSTLHAACPECLKNLQALWCAQVRSCPHNLHHWSNPPLGAPALRHL